MKEIMGGCWLAGLLALVILGLVPGLVLFGIGAVAGSWALIKEKEAEQAENNWRKN